MKHLFSYEHSRIRLSRLYMVYGLSSFPLILFLLFFPFLFISSSGSSETQVFDERSPSGNDYLAEVK